MLDFFLFFCLILIFLVTRCDEIVYSNMIEFSFVAPFVRFIYLLLLQRQNCSQLGMHDQAVLHVSPKKLRQIS